MTGIFSKLVCLGDLGPEGVTLHLEASPDARVGIATRLSIPEVTALSGDITLRPDAGGASAEGVVRARLRRVCVVTLEEIEEEVDESFSIRFARGLPDDDVELALEDEWSEPLDGDTLDAADILVQQVAIAMDPYPRKPGAEMPQALAAGPEEVSPFAALRALKKPSCD